VNNVVERRQTLPVLSNLLMLAENGQLVLTGTDMEVEVIARIDAAIESEGTVTIPARKLLDIVKALPTGAQCDLTLSGEKFQVRSGRSRFSLSTIPARDFPVLTAAEGGELKLTLPAKTLLWLIDSTQFAMAHQTCVIT
jgi:DNA polymerase sliding clamp subunit (PCNA homolog)